VTVARCARCGVRWNAASAVCANCADKPDARAAIERLCSDLGQELGNACPPGQGFLLLLFDFGTGLDESMAYVSNAQRQDIVKMLRELARKLEGS
jgi:hypothetical protein